MHILGSWPLLDNHAIESWATPDGETAALADQFLWMIGRPLDRQSRQVLSAPEVLSRYREAGVDFVQSLAGSFALAVADPARSRLILGIDRMGVERMTYAVRDGQLVFSDSASRVARSPVIRAEVCDQSLYDYLFFHMVPAPRTAFRQVCKLVPGTLLIAEPAGVRVHTYWQPQTPDRYDCTMPDMVEQLHAHLADAVEASVSSERTGAFLSGGLDSSTIAGLLKRTRPDAETFSVGFGVEEYDELAFARAANSHFGLTGHEYTLTSSDIVDSFADIAGEFDEPFGNSSVVPTLYCARMAKQHGIHTLLAGDGGDELFGGNERYARQKIFESYYAIPRPLRAPIEHLAGRLAAGHSLLPLRKLKSFVDQATIPLPERLESWNFAFREGLASMLTPEFLSRVDPASPVRHMRAVYDDAHAPDTLNRLLMYDWRLTLADNDLRKVKTMCRLAGVDVAFPFLDDALVAFSLAVPPGWKMRGLELRSFYRKAMRGFLPDAVLAKSKHGFGLPFGVWLKEDRDLGDLVRDRLDTLKERGIVSARFLDGLLQEHRDGHASYYGYFIWDLAILEEWLRRHG